MEEGGLPHLGPITKHMLNPHQGAFFTMTGGHQLSSHQLEMTVKVYCSQYLLIGSVLARMVIEGGVDGHRTLGWGLQHHCIARHECGGNFTDCQIHGIVEGWDAEHDTQADFARQAELVPCSAREGI